MVKRHLARLVVALSGVIALVAMGSTAAIAAPTNDEFTAAIAVDTLPFATTLDTTDATWNPTDPTACSSNGSVWYSYTPTSSTRIQADTFGSGYDTVLSAWTGSQDSLTQVACNDDYQGTQSLINFAATAGTTYYFMLARCCGSGSDGGGPLTFNVQEIPSSANDSFANAVTVGALPYSNTQNYSASTTEAGEPSPCFTPTATGWYSYTATSTGPITASTDAYYPGIAAYTGTSVSNLVQVGCRTTYASDPLTFVAQAGTTYYFQVEANTIQQITFKLDEAPDPVANFSYYPSDPSAYDTVQYNSYSTDPAGVGISSYSWDFGDGTTSTQQNASHRYAADGDYTVLLTVRTTDGRSDTATEVVRVRTHDVSIHRLNVPATARVGQTIGISVYVQNTRYPENVQVTLAKSVPYGFVDIGYSTQLVKVSTTGKTTRFSFNYTVTNDDVAVGKVTFRATATLMDNRDALPADNQLLSTPVRIS